MKNEINPYFALPETVELDTEEVEALSPEDIEEERAFTLEGQEVIDECF